MNSKWPIVGLLAVCSCNHSSRVAHSTQQVPDTVTALPTTAMNANRSTSKAADRQTLKAAGHSRRYTADLNGDQIADTITIVSSIGDTATFDTIHIDIAHFGSATYFTDTLNPWTTVDDEFLESNKNDVETNRFFLATNKLQSVLLLFGDLSPAGYRDDFSIINIEDNTPKLVLNQNQRHLAIESPLKLEDLDGDGRLDFLYRQIFEYNGRPDTLNGKIGTYSPYFVYSVDSNCDLNRPLTIRYNKEHYVFAGFKYDERIDVFYPNDGTQPRLWKR